MSRGLQGFRVVGAGVRAFSAPIARTRRIALAGGLCACAALPGIGLRAQQAPAVANATATATAVAVPTGTMAPVLDGRLDDPAWRAATPIADLRQREPLEGVEASERTEVRVLFDATTLYVAVHAFDREPARIVARILERDRLMQSAYGGTPQFGGDDAVALLFDGMHDHRNAMVLATNANGAEFDGLITDEGREFNVDWRGIWRVASARTDDGWVAEFAIPFRSLRYRPGEPEWGFNVYRMIRRAAGTDAPRRCGAGAEALRGPRDARRGSPA